MHKSFSSELARDVALSSGEIRKTKLAITIGSLLGPLSTILPVSERHGLELIWSIRIAKGGRMIGDWYQTFPRTPMYFFLLE